MTEDEYAQLYALDQEANDAARQAAWEAGEAQPHGFLDGLAANWMSYQGQRWEDTPRARSRLEASLPEHARLGAQAYVMGLPGNAYTDFLRARFG